MDHLRLLLLTIQPKQYSILTPVLDRIGSLF